MKQFTTYKQYLLIGSLLIALLLPYTGLLAQCGGILNGLLNGKPHKPPHAWSTHKGHARLLPVSNLRQVGPSPQGGIVLMLKDHKEEVLTAKTTISGLVAGNTYILSWYDAIEPRLYGTNTLNATYQIIIDGVPKSIEKRSSLWTQEALTFTAQSSQVNLSFQFIREGVKPSILLLDGLKINCSRVCDLQIPRYSKN